MVVVRIVVAAPPCPPLVAVVWPVFVGPAGVGGVWLPVPPLLPLFGVWGWRSLALPFLWRCSPFGGWVPGLGGVGVVSAH